MSADINRLALRLPCDYCGAELWNRCVTKSGKRTRLVHSIRWYAARDEFFERVPADVTGFRYVLKPLEPV